MPTPEISKQGQSSVTSPASFAEPVVVDVDFSEPCRALYVAGAGNVVARMQGSLIDVVFSSVPAGQILPIRAIRLVAGTTATGVVAIW